MFLETVTFRACLHLSADENICGIQVFDVFSRHRSPTTAHFLYLIDGRRQRAILDCNRNISLQRCYKLTTPSSTLTVEWISSSSSPQKRESLVFAATEGMCVE